LDLEAARKEFERLMKEMATAYLVMTVTLAMLPIPMRLPMRQADDPRLVLYSLDRAWELAGWEPLEDRAVRRVREMITGWLTAYELAVLAADFGPAPWRLRGIEQALRSCRESSGWIRGFFKWVKNPRGPMP
jgi:hypothetical protein